MLDKFSGGRSLDAIWQNKNLSSTVKLVLLCFVKELDFTGDFTEWRYYSNEAFSRDTSLTIRCVQKTLIWLIDNGYLDKKIDNTVSGRQLCNSYRLTEKLFTEASSAQVKVAIGERSTPVKVAIGERSSGGGVNVVHPNSFIISPNKNNKTMCVITSDIIAPQESRVRINTHTSEDCSPVKMTASSTVKPPETDIDQIIQRFNNEQAVENGKVRFWKRVAMEKVIAGWILKYGFDIVNEITEYYYRQHGYPMDFLVREFTQWFADAQENAKWQPSFNEAQPEMA